jgi:ATP-dependent protease ClpP protease subunit
MMRTFLAALSVVAMLLPTMSSAQDMVAIAVPPSLDDCTVKFVDPINFDTMRNLVQELSDTDKACSETLLIIQTDGGDVDAFNFYKNDFERFRLHTHVRARADSMGVPLFMTGDVRTMDPDATLMLHPTKFSITGENDTHNLDEIALRLHHD